MVPIFCASMMSMFLNQQQLNIYAECDSPNDFFFQATGTIIAITLLFAVPIGYLGYLAFGSKTKSVILYNLPNEDPASIVAKVFYVINLMGSFVVIA